MPTGIWETVWRSAGAAVGITIDSILIVESNRALGLAPWGRYRGAHGALFKQVKVLKQHSLTVVRIIRKVDIIVEFSIVGKNAAVASFHCLVIFEENYNIIN